MAVVSSDIFWQSFAMRLQIIPDFTEGFETMATAHLAAILLQLKCQYQAIDGNKRRNR